MFKLLTFSKLHICNNETFISLKKLRKKLKFSKRQIALLDPYGM